MFVSNRVLSYAKMCVNAAPGLVKDQQKFAMLQTVVRQKMFGIPLSFNKVNKKSKCTIPITDALSFRKKTKISSNME